MLGLKSGTSICGFVHMGEPTKLTYRFEEGNTKLEVTIENASEDYVEPDKVLAFLGEKKVVSKPKEWKLVHAGDSNGNTLEDDLWWTGTFHRTIKP